MSEPTPQPDRPCPGAALYLADCRDVLPGLPSGSFDLVFTDPPYPCIDRSYGTWTEAGWWDVMRAVAPECMRVLKPTGSAVFVLQPNSERVGRMRTWLWDFMAWVGREWGIVQDAWWFRFDPLPIGGANTGGLLRESLKACVWVGPHDCYRCQENVLWRESDANRVNRMAERVDREPRLSGWRGAVKPKFDSGRRRNAASRRGGVTPLNVLPISNGDSCHSAGANGHAAGTPFELCLWWLRYLCPPGGSVLDPFSGSGTTGLAALKHGCDYTGVERIPEHHATARRRLAEAAGPLFATPGGA